MRNPFKVIRERWTAYLERLAKSNAETFGRERMDCCDMNSMGKSITKENPHKSP